MTNTTPAMIRDHALSMVAHYTQQAALADELMNGAGNIDRRVRVAGRNWGAATCADTYFRSAAMIVLRKRESP